MKRRIGDVEAHVHTPVSDWIPWRWGRGAMRPCIGTDFHIARRTRWTINEITAKMIKR